MSNSFNSNKNGSPNYLVIGLVLAFVATTGVTVWSILATDDKVTQSNNAQNAQAQELFDSQIPTPQDGADPKGGISGSRPIQIDIAAASSAINSKVATLDTQVGLIVSNQEAQAEETAKAIEELKAEMRKREQQAAQDMAQIVELMQQNFDRNRAEDRNSVIELPDELNFEESGGVIFENETGSEDSQTSSSTVAPSKPSNTYQMFRSSKAPAKKAVDSSAFRSDEEESEPEDEYYTIELPGNAFANAETLYGVRCPIVSNVVSGMASAGGNLRVPVVLPIRSQFKGPNGDIETVGTASILAECYGQRTSDSNVGRAVLELKKISFVDDNQEKHWEDISGVVIDSKTETIFIEGPIDKARSNNIWTRALYAAASTAAFGFSAQNVVLTQSDGAGGYEQSFEGDPIKDMAAQGIGGYFQDIQAGYAELMNAAIDTVGVPSGRDIKVVLHAPITFKVKVAKNDFYASQESFLF